MKARHNLLRQRSSLQRRHQARNRIRQSPGVESEEAQKTDRNGNQLGIFEDSRATKQIA